MKSDSPNRDCKRGENFASKVVKRSRPVQFVPLNDRVPFSSSYWAKALAVETEKVVAANREKLMQKEIERYLQHAIGAKPRGMMYAPTSHR